MSQYGKDGALRRPMVGASALRCPRRRAKRQATEHERRWYTHFHFAARIFAHQPNSRYSLFKHFGIQRIIIKFMSTRIPYRTVAADTYQALLGVHQHLSKLTDPRLRALIELRVSQINGCAFCLDMHANEARHLGETQQRLDCVAAFREAPFFTDKEKAALAWAESLTCIAETRAPDDVYNEVKKHFSEKELVDLTAGIGMINLWNRLSIAFRSEPKERKAV